jgi:hypothetical protein
VLTAIQLDSQFLFAAVKVKHVRIDWVLTAKLESTLTAIAEAAPQNLLGVGLRLTQVPVKFQQIGRQYRSWLHRFTPER